jgi:hypothetical protein
MCESCPAHILGPGEVAGKVARSKAGRKVASVLFYGTVWTIGVPLLPFAIWGIFGWWTIPLGALALAAFAVGVACVYGLHARQTVLTRPEPTPQMRAALAARGLRPIPAPGQAARPALPRAVVRSLTGRRQALPAPARALPGVVTGKVVPAPVRKVVG